MALYESAEDPGKSDWRRKWFALLHGKLGVESTDFTGSEVRTYRIGSCSFDLREDADDTADGQVVFDAGLLLAGYVATQKASLGACLELGCGVGIVGLAAVASGNAASVVLTDGVDGCVTLAQQNVELASLADRAKAVRLVWGDSPEERNVFDTVLIGDVIFYRKWTEILRTVLAAMKPDGKVLICHRIRSEDEMEFFDVARDHGFRHRRILFPPGVYDWIINDQPIEDVRPITHRCELYELVLDGGAAADGRAPQPEDTWTTLD
jgi:predicted nicotinamide N-methyase